MHIQYALWMSWRELGPGWTLMEEVSASVSSPLLLHECNCVQWQTFRTCVCMRGGWGHRHQGTVTEKHMRKGIGVRDKVQRKYLGKSGPKISVCLCVACED